MLLARTREPFMDSTTIAALLILSVDIFWWLRK